MPTIHYSGPYSRGASDNRSEIREFLSTRRARITPEQARLPSYGTKRRVPGLRREQVAMLAGVRVDYYTRLERGDLRSASNEVLDALTRALQLDEAERAHLFDLARAAGSRDASRRRTAPGRFSPSAQRVRAAITGTPAWVRNGRADVVATNQLGRALYWPMFDGSVRRPNTARFTFLDPRARDPGTSCATPASPGCGRPGWPSRRPKPRPGTPRSKRPGSIRTCPTTGSRGVPAGDGHSPWLH